MDIFITVRKSTNGQEFYDFHGIGFSECDAISRAINFGQLISTSDWKVNEFNPIVRSRKVIIPEIGEEDEDRQERKAVIRFLRDKTRHGNLSTYCETLAIVFESGKHREDDIDYISAEDLVSK